MEEDKKDKKKERRDKKDKKKERSHSRSSSSCSSRSSDSSQSSSGDDHKKKWKREQKKYRKTMKKQGIKVPKVQYPGKGQKGGHPEDGYAYVPPQGYSLPSAGQPGDPPTYHVQDPAYPPGAGPHSH